LQANPDYFVHFVNNKSGGGKKKVGSIIATDPGLIGRMSAMNSPAKSRKAVKPKKSPIMPNLTKRVKISCNIFFRLLQKFLREKDKKEGKRGAELLLRTTVWLLL